MRFNKIIVANWKMAPGSYSKAIDLFNSYIENIIFNDNQLIIAPPAIYLAKLQELLIDSNKKNFYLSAQNVGWEQFGAFTGELSADMFYDLGCRFAIIGHSERRNYNKETNELINQKFLMTIKAKLTPIVCVGETKEQYEAGSLVVQNSLDQQLIKILKQANNLKIKEFFVAYEPVWAIGTGNSADLNYINIICGSIREKIENLLTKNNEVKILYGGSVNSTNAQNIFKIPHIDGALIGGASLDPQQFVQICNCLN